MRNQARKIEREILQFQSS